MRCSELHGVDVTVVDPAAADLDATLFLCCQRVYAPERPKLRLVHPKPGVPILGLSVEHLEIDFQDGNAVRGGVRHR